MNTNELEKNASKLALDDETKQLAALLSKITGDNGAGLRYIDWFYNREKYYERVKSGYYDKFSIIEGELV